MILTIDATALNVSVQCQYTCTCVYIFLLN